MKHNHNVAKDFENERVQPSFIDKGFTNSANNNGCSDINRETKRMFKLDMGNIIALIKEISSLQKELTDTIATVSQKYEISAPMLRKFAAMQRKIGTKEFEQKQRDYQTICRLLDVPTQVSMDDLGLL